MATVIGLLVLFFGGAVIGRSVTQARSQPWAGPRSAGMRQRAGSRAVTAAQRPVRQEARLLRLNAQLADWREERSHARKNGGGPPVPARPPALGGRARTAVTAVKRLGSFSTGSSVGGGNGSGGSAPAAANGSGHAPPAAPKASPSPSGSPGRTTTVAAGTSTGSVEKLIEGVNQIHAEAAAGGIHAKQRGIKSAVEGSIRFSAMAAMLSRAMSEPGANYGPEITEPLAKASEHLQAAAMAFSESDTNLTTLLNMSVGELASSSRQAPHHGELSESGSR
jgi:hypothetical protein